MVWSESISRNNPRRVVVTKLVEYLQRGERMRP